MKKNQLRTSLRLSDSSIVFFLTHYKSLSPDLILAHGQVTPMTGESTAESGSLLDSSPTIQD